MKGVRALQDLFFSLIYANVRPMLPSWQPLYPTYPPTTTSPPPAPLGASPADASYGNKARWRLEAV